jgi:hypothetical protein
MIPRPVLRVKNDSRYEEEIEFSNNWSRFIVLESSEGCIPLTKLSPFVIEKWVYSNSRISIMNASFVSGLVPQWNNRSKYQLLVWPINLTTAFFSDPFSCLWPLLHRDGRSNGPDSINRLVTSSPLTDPVNTVQVCSCCCLTEILGVEVSSVMTLRGGKEGMVGHFACHHINYSFDPLT